MVCPANPTVQKTPFHGEVKPGDWQFEAAEDFKGNAVVFQSELLPPEIGTIIDQAHGKFIGELSGKTKLDSGKIYYLRVRQQNSEGISSDWSRWHQGFRVE